VKACTKPPTTEPRVRKSAALGVERRRSERRWIDGVATVFELNGAHFGQMHTLCQVDYSDGGMGAVCPQALPNGTSISVGFQSPQCSARFGNVIRCDRINEGYRLGILFQ